MTFGEWINAQMRAKEIGSDAELARRGGFDQSLIKRWRESKEPPKAHTMRRVARAFDVPLLQVMVAAGYLSEEEAEMTEVQADLSAVPDADLLRELSDRMGHAVVPAPKPKPSASAVRPGSQKVSMQVDGVREDYWLVRNTEHPEDVGHGWDGRERRQAGRDERKG